MTKTKPKINKFVVYLAKCRKISPTKKYLRISDRIRRNQGERKLLKAKIRTQLEDMYDTWIDRVESKKSTGWKVYEQFEELLQQWDKDHELDNNISSDEVLIAPPKEHESDSGEEMSDNSSDDDGSDDD